MNRHNEPIETNEYHSVDGAEGEFLWSSSPQNVDLLPQRPNLRLKHYPRSDQIDNHPTNEPAKIPHCARSSSDSRSTAKQDKVCDRGNHRLIQRVVSASHRGQRYVPALRPVPASAFPVALRSMISKQLGQVTCPMGSVCRRSPEVIIASSRTGIQGILFGLGSSLASWLVCEPL